MKTLQDKIRGSLIGGAIGDALGYPVEFMSIASIKKRFGERGITRFEPQNGKAVVSDDTQMTLFTACGLLNAKPQDKLPKLAISEAYIEWYYTQTWRKPDGPYGCWISSIPELNKRRAPGNTCMSALNDIAEGRNTHNDSKGCGGIMRTAPVALYAAIDGRMSIQDSDVLAADAAEITHQHPLGWLPSELENHIIYRLLQNDSPTVEDFKAYLAEGYDALRKLYPKQERRIEALKALTDKALSLADSPSSDAENMEAIGGGWVGDEALAMAVYCTAKYFDDFEQAMIAAVNHGGDSDSIGAIAGNIIGTVVGYESIPQHFKDDLELHDVILHVADDLWSGETTKFAEE